METSISSTERMHILSLVYALIAILLTSILVTANAFGQSSSYSYSPYEKVDPFFPSIVVTAPREAISPLQRQPLSDLTLVGTVIGKQSSALILGKGDGSGTTTYVVRVGDLIGLRGGVVVSIFADRIIVREPLDPSDRRNFSRFQDSSLILRPFDRNVTASNLLRDVSENASQDRNSLTEALTADVMPKDVSRRTEPKGSLIMGGGLNGAKPQQENRDTSSTETKMRLQNQNNQKNFSNTLPSGIPLGSGSNSLGLPVPSRIDDTKPTTSLSITPAAATTLSPPPAPTGGITIQQFAPPTFTYPSPIQGGLPNAQP